MISEDADPVGITLLVTEVLAALDVRYLIGGSLASIFHGMIRTTNDADLLADLRPEHAQPLALALQADFYMDPESIREATLEHSSFNVIHLATSFKVDVYIARLRAFDRAQLSRRRREVVTVDPERTIFVASPEDTILAKLEWYEIGDRVSERQWRDVLGVVKAQGDRLDLEYLRQMAAMLGVSELLEQALVAAEH